HAADGPGDRAQHRVPGRVAEAVVDGLEVVEIHAGGGERTLVAAGARAFGAGRLAEGRGARPARQRTRPCEPPRPVARLPERGHWRSQASGLARKRGVMASKITRQQPRATFPGLTEGSGYEREAAVPGCLGTGVPDHAEAAQGLPRGESRPEAARTLPRRERTRMDLRLRGGGGREGPLDLRAVGGRAVEVV